MYVPELMPRDPPEPGGPCRRLDDPLQQPGRVARASPGRREDQVRWPDRGRHAAMTAQQGTGEGSEWHCQLDEVSALLCLEAGCRRWFRRRRSPHSRPETPGFSTTGGGRNVADVGPLGRDSAPGRARTRTAARGRGRLEAAHLALTLTGRLMRDFRAIVFVLPGTVDHGRHHGTVRRRIAA